MIGVRIKNALSIRWGTIKGFDRDRTNSVGTTNNTTPAAASNAFFAESVEKKPNKQKQMKVAVQVKRIEVIR